MGCRTRARHGVRRGRGSSGLIWLNGHPPISPTFADAALDLLGRTARPMTAREIGAELNYNHQYAGSTLKSMTMEGLVDRVMPSPCTAAFYHLPGMDPAVDDTPAKQCSRCREVKKVTEFHRDRAQSMGVTLRCRACRSVSRREQAGLVPA